MKMEKLQIGLPAQRAALWDRLKKIAKQELERSRLSKSWNSERQMAKASSAYDANIMTGTAASGDFMLG